MDILVFPYRNIFCNLSHIKFEDIASWLMVAFVLSREVPAVSQKVIFSIFMLLFCDNFRVIGLIFWLASFVTRNILDHDNCLDNKKIKLNLKNVYFGFLQLYYGSWNPRPAWARLYYISSSMFIIENYVEVSSIATHISGK